MGGAAPQRICTLSIGSKFMICQHYQCAMSLHAATMQGLPMQPSRQQVNATATSQQCDILSSLVRQVVLQASQKHPELPRKPVLVQKTMLAGTLASVPHDLPPSTELDQQQAVRAPVV